MFGAFVLDVPIFAVTIEIIGWKTKDPRYAISWPMSSRNCSVGFIRRRSMTIKR